MAAQTTETSADAPTTVAETEKDRAALETRQERLLNNQKMVSKYWMQLLEKYFQKWEQTLISQYM